jgi:hypothetical protein
VQHQHEEEEEQRLDFHLVDPPRQLPPPLEVEVDSVLERLLRPLLLLLVLVVRQLLLHRDLALVAAMPLHHHRPLLLQRVPLLLPRDLVLGERQLPQRYRLPQQQTQQQQRMLPKLRQREDLVLEEEVVVVLRLPINRQRRNLLPVLVLEREPQCQQQQQQHRPRHRLLGFTIEQILNRFQSELETDSIAFLQEAQRISHYNAVIRD